MCPRPCSILADGSPLTPQENFVLRQVAQGEIADLEQEFGDAEENRQLRARFLEDLLSGGQEGMKIHHRGVLLRNAVIMEGLDLANIEVAGAVELENCLFMELVNFRDARFAKHFSISGSLFLDNVSFLRMQVDSSLACWETAFEGSVDFRSVCVSGRLMAGRARFLGHGQEVSFSGMQVKQSASLEEAEFHGPVDGEGLSVGWRLELRGAKFLAENQQAHFVGIRIGQDLRLEEASFHGEVDFFGAAIQGQLLAQGARFLSFQKANFKGMQVGQDVFFQGCNFYGLASFNQVSLAGDLHLEPLLKIGQELATTFHSDVNFHGAAIGGELLAEKTQFLGHISNFEAVQVGRSFHGSGAIFGGTVNFREMQVRNNFYVDPFGRMKSFKTLFKGAANFSNLEVHGVFNADQAIFQSESTIFSGLRVGQGAFFIGTIFYGGLVLKEGQLNDLVIRGLHRLSKGGLPLTEIVLNRTSIGHRMTIEDLEVKRFDARDLEVQGPAELRRLFIRDEADLRAAALHHLQLVEVDWPEPRARGERVYLDGLVYESITTRRSADQPEDWPGLLAWLGLSRFNTRNYQQLDAYLQRGGLRKWGDKVHSAGRRRALRQQKWWHPARWLTRVFWDWLAGYGRRPGRVIWAGLFLLILGALVLNPAEVLAPEFLGSLAGYQDNIFHRAALRLIVSLYSLVAAIPGWSSHLSLSSPGFHTFVYLWFQRICGWILIPIGLAALYARLK